MGESAPRVGFYVAKENTHSNIDIDGYGLDRQLRRRSQSGLERDQYKQQ
jgi:hypothetical protein